MTHHLKTRIVLANGGHAKWLERDGAHFVILSELSAEPEAAGRHTATVHHSTAPFRHGAGEQDLAAAQRRKFARQVATRLNHQSAHGEFQRLALVAPPEVLREIREALLPGVHGKLVHELAKDLTKTPVHDLGDWLNSPLFG